VASDGTVGRTAGSLSVGDVLFPGHVTEPPSDTRPSSSSAVVAIVLGILMPLIFICGGMQYFQRRKARQQIAMLRQELEKFKDSLAGGLLAVTETFDPRTMDTFQLAQDVDAVGAFVEATHSRVSDGGGRTAACSEVGVEIAPDSNQRQVARASWYWQEDSHSISKHNPRDVKQPGNWVSYAGSVHYELDALYGRWVGGGPAVVTVDLADRIGSTGTEQKAANQHTGMIFSIDFTTMKQANVKSSFQRSVLREEIAAAAPAAARVSNAGARTSSVSAAPPRRSSAGGGGRKSSTRLAEVVSADFPRELAGEDALIMFEGQILQTSKQRNDGWAFGSVVHDVMEDRPPLGVDGLSTQAGWFPLSRTQHPSADQLKVLQKQMGDNASDALKPPSTWGKMADPMTAELTKLPEGGEKQGVVAAFMKTLKPNFQVIDVQRVQNMSMWQSYAVKRQTIVMREKKAVGDVADDASRCEKVWLFHGTDQDTVPKIFQQGFNRSFCGKNMCRYGKGVYFARDASYSATTTYSCPNDKGIQHIFLCRVVVGEYCLGKNNALTPDVRTGHQLYDTTVNDMHSPGIFVTYHDAQAYPEYLVRFKQ